MAPASPEGATCAAALPAAGRAPAGMPLPVCPRAGQRPHCLRRSLQPCWVEASSARFPWARRAPLSRQCWGALPSARGSPCKGTAHPRPGARGLRRAAAARPVPGVAIGQLSSCDAPDGTGEREHATLGGLPAPSAAPARKTSCDMPKQPDPRAGFEATGQWGHRAEACHACHRTVSAAPRPGLHSGAGSGPCCPHGAGGRGRAGAGAGLTPSRTPRLAPPACRLRGDSNSTSARATRQRKGVSATRQGQPDH